MASRDPRILDTSNACPQGTNTSDWKEILTDISFALTSAAKPILWGTPIHNGFYHTIFTPFAAIGEAPLSRSIPLTCANETLTERLDYIKIAIDDAIRYFVNDPGTTTYLHTTVSLRYIHNVKTFASLPVLRVILWEEHTPL